MAKDGEELFDDMDLPHIITISWTEDGALDVDSGDNMTPAEVLGQLLLAAGSEFVAQVATALGIKLPEEED